jgi:hypothetical protein
MKRMLLLFTVLLPLWGTGNVPARDVVTRNSVSDIELIVASPLLTKPSSHVKITVTLVNHRKESIYYDDNGAPFNVDAATLNGTPIRPTETGKKELNVGIPTHGRLENELKPGAELTRQYDLSELFEINGEGKYGFSVWRDFVFSNGSDWGKVQVREQEFYVGNSLPSRIGVPDD